MLSRKPNLLSSVLWTGIALAPTAAIFAQENHPMTVSQTRDYPAQIIRSFTEPIERSVAASAETGIIASAHVKEGDRVQVGDVLAAINHSVLDQSLAIAQARAASTARVDAATSQLEITKSQLEAIKSLVKGGHTNDYEVKQTQADYDNALAEYRTAVDGLELEKLEAKRIEAQIDDRIIKSPINGFVTEIHKQLGENVSSNEPQYATIVRIDQLKARFYLDAVMLEELSVGDHVEIFVGRDPIRSQAEITFISPVIDPDSGLGRVDVTLPNQDFKIKSGVVCVWAHQPIPDSTGLISASPLSHPNR